MSHHCCPPIETRRDEPGQAIDHCCTSLQAGRGRTAAVTPSNLCSTCGQTGKKVDRLTLKAMLEVSLLAVREGPYLFCRTAECPVVYFSANRSQSFTKAQIRVPVHQKEPGDKSVPVCYCFRHSPATIWAELLAMGQSTVVEEINEGIRAGQCACEIRNPQGSCCLGNVRAVMKRLLGESGALVTFR